MYKIKTTKGVCQSFQESIFSSQFISYLCPYDYINTPFTPFIDMTQTKTFFILLCTGLVFQNFSCKNAKQKQVTSSDSDEAASTRTAPANQQVLPTERMIRKDSTYLLGVWYDPSIKAPQGGKVAYQVISTGSETFIQPIVFTGTKLNVSEHPVISSSASKIQKTGNRYVSVDSPEIAYEVDKEGNLLIFDKDGLVVKCGNIL